MNVPAPLAPGSPADPADAPAALPPPPPGVRLARSAGLIGIATMASRVLGLVRDMVFARLFGAGDTMDAFNVAFRIPNLVRDLFAEGAMSAAFVPDLHAVSHAARDRTDAWRLGNLVISALLVATGVVVLLGDRVRGSAHPALRRGVCGCAGKLELTTRLTRVMFPFLTLVAIAVACMGMLNSLGHFFVPALSPAMFNVGAIVARRACWCRSRPCSGSIPAMALALGTLLGGLLQALIQWPPLGAKGSGSASRSRPRSRHARDPAC